MFGPNHFPLTEHGLITVIHWGEFTVRVPTLKRRKLVTDNKVWESGRSSVANAITNGLGTPIVGHLGRTTKRVSKRDIYRLKAKMTSDIDAFSGFT